MSENLNELRVIGVEASKSTIKSMKAISGEIKRLCDLLEDEMNMHEQTLQGFYLAATDRAEKAEATLGEIERELSEIEIEYKNYRSNY